MHGWGRGCGWVWDVAGVSDMQPGHDTWWLVLCLFILLHLCLMLPPKPRLDLSPKHESEWSVTTRPHSGPSPSIFDLPSPFTHSLSLSFTCSLRHTQPVWEAPDGAWLPDSREKWWMDGLRWSAGLFSLHGGSVHSQAALTLCNYMME